MRYPVLAILIVAGLALLHQPQEPVAGPVPCDAQSRVPATPQPVILSDAPLPLASPQPPADSHQPAAPKPTGAADVPQTAKDSPAPSTYPLYPDKPRKGPAYVEPNTAQNWYRHLCNDHGFDRAWVMWLHRQPRGMARLEALHGDAHNEVVNESLAVYSSRRPAVTAVRATAIKWVTEREARADKTKPDWYFCTRLRGCPACIIAKGNFYNPAVISASQDFNCVMVYGDDYGRFKRWANYRRFQVSLFPTDVFVPVDEQSAYWYPGKPVTAELLLRFEDALTRFKTPALRNPATPRVTSPQQLRALLPTLAAPFVPRTEEVVEGPQQSVVTRRALRSGYAPTASAPAVVSRPRSNWTHPSAGRTQKPGPLGRATFRPQGLLR
jgi:hypothetical protein